MNFAKGRVTLLILAAFVCRSPPVTVAAEMVRTHLQLPVVGS
jgi:hypothetical protein